MRLIIVGAMLCIVAGCSGTQVAETVTGPSSFGQTSVTPGGIAGARALAPVGHVAISCPHEPVQWATGNAGPVGRTFQAPFYPVINADAYQVEIAYSRDGIEPQRVLTTFITDRTEVRVVDTERGGRYYVRVRVKTTCDDFGDWSSVLTVYFDGLPDRPSSAPPIIIDPPDDPGDDPGDDLGDESGPCHAQASVSGHNPNHNPPGQGGDNPGQGNPGGNPDPNPDHGCDNGNPGQGHN